MRGGLGILLIFVAVGYLLFFVVFPSLVELRQDSLIYTAFETVACGTNNGSLEIEREVSSSRDGGTSFSAIFRCFDPKTEQWVDQSGKMFLIGGVGFTILLVAGILLTIKASQSWMSEIHKPVQMISPPQHFPQQGFGATNFSQSPSSQISLKDRLSQLDDARAINLITAEEYDRMRKEIIEIFPSSREKF